MWFFKKKVSLATGEDRELIAANSKAVDALIVLAENDKELVVTLKELQEKLKYLMPSQDSKVYDYDKNIGNIIGDLRIVMTKADGKGTDKIKEKLRDINLVIADRGVRIERS